jgi:hypothetical protein
MFGGPFQLPRGSKRRLKRLRLREHLSQDVVLFLVLLVIALAILIPWRLNHPHVH